MNRIVGIDLLKAGMSFIVVYCHYGYADNSILSYVLGPFRRMAVPVFMLMSFFLTYKMYLPRPYKCSSFIVLKRLKRIYVPLIIWALIYYFVYLIMVHYGLIHANITIRCLIMQIAVGHCLNPAMWFNFVLAVLTVVCFFCMSKSNIISYVAISTIISLLLQYSGLNMEWFYSFPHELRYPLGRIVEMIPYASLGILLGYLNYIKDFRRIVYVCIILFVGYTISVFINRGLYMPNELHFGYGGIELLLLSTICLILCINIPSGLLPDKIYSGIIFLSNYSMGVYCIHLLVGKCLSVADISMSPLMCVIVVYMLSLLISFIISKIPIRCIASIVE